MRVVLNEQQLDRIIMEERLINEGVDPLIKKLVKIALISAMNIYGIVGMVKHLNLPKEEEEYVTQEVINGVNNTKNTTDNSVYKDTVGLKEVMEDTIPKEGEWKCISNGGIVTVYNAVPEQCNADPSRTSSLFHMDLKHPENYHIVAMDREFMKNHGIKFGDVIKVEGTYQGKQDGVYQVQDLMNKRFANQPKVDVLCDRNTKYGGTAEGEHANIYILTNKKRTHVYTDQFPKSLNNIEDKQGYDYRKQVPFHYKKRIK